ncbi:MAG: hypothetical protein AB1483_11610 [Candidatus Zixiibacteriota bacterium]
MRTSAAHEAHLQDLPELAAGSVETSPLCGDPDGQGISTYRCVGQVRTSAAHESGHNFCKQKSRPDTTA